MLAEQAADGNPRPYQVCVAAYNRFVSFKASTMSLTPVAAPSSGLSSGWSLLRCEAEGSNVTYYSGIDTSTMSDVELAKAAVFRAVSTAEKFRRIARGATSKRIRWIQCSISTCYCFVHRSEQFTSNLGVPPPLLDPWSLAHVLSAFGSCATGRWWWCGRCS